MQFFSFFPLIHANPLLTITVLSQLLKKAISMALWTKASLFAENTKLAKT